MNKNNNDYTKNKYNDEAVNRKNSVEGQYASKKKALPLMIQGTHSDAGKSVIATAFCRIFAQDRHKTAPFKSQNMALNSYITVDGKEIGRAQGVQAEAACVQATTDMNPILIKPSRENESQIVVHGKPYRNMQAVSYRQDFFQKGLAIITEAYERLANQYERIVIEGAGSPAEVNLNDREIVNMRVAQIANAPVILVGDIDKGGVFASLVGTLQLLKREDRQRVIGVIINKFRGDISLLEPGLTWFEEYTGVPVLGVLPYVEGLNIDAEDSVILNRYSMHKNDEKPIDIAVIRLPMISNFTDIDPFTVEDDCHIRFVRSEEELGEPDMVILPGSKNTIEDMMFLRERGLAEKIKKLARSHKSLVFGICGGYQMLGHSIEDPHHVESPHDSVEGLQLLPLRTTLNTEKTTILSEGTVNVEGRSIPVSGYEIHMGETVPLYDYDPTNQPYRPCVTMEHRQEGCVQNDWMVWGTYFHGIFHNDAFRTAIINKLRIAKGLSPIEERVSFNQLREKAFDQLAEHVRKHIDLEYIELKMKEFQQHNDRHIELSE